MLSPGNRLMMPNDTISFLRLHRGWFKESAEYNLVVDGHFPGREHFLEFHPLIIDLRVSDFCHKADQPNCFEAYIDVEYYSGESRSADTCLFHISDGIIFNYYEVVDLRDCADGLRALIVGRSERAEQRIRTKIYENFDKLKGGNRWL